MQQPGAGGMPNLDQLLDFSQGANFDVRLLDYAVAAFYNTAHPQQAQANQVLTQMRNNPASWTRVDRILEQSQSQETKFLALQILADTVKFRWKALPAAQRDGIKNYVVTKIISLSTSDESAKREALFLKKLNEVLVGVLKQDWPHNWPSFIGDIVGSSKSSESICENNLRILYLLSEEIFEFSKEDMVSAKVQTLKKTLHDEFAKIFRLANFVLTNSKKVTLLLQTLRTLARFAFWIPQGYFFETQILPMLTGKFLHVPDFRNDVLAVLTEVIGDREIPQQYHPILCQCFTAVLDKMGAMLPPSVNVRVAFDGGSELERQFIQKLSLFLQQTFKRWLPLYEAQQPCHPAIIRGMEYLARISEVDHDVIFKICLDHWHDLSQELYNAMVSIASPAVLQLGAGMMSIGGGSGANAGNMAFQRRHNTYKPVLSAVRRVLIARMAKPEEVLVVENQDGEVIRETTKDTAALALYKTMRETLVCLTHLNYEDTESIMHERLASQVDGSAWSRRNLNTLCWAIGSISGAMSVENEKRFIVTVIKDLLGLCDHMGGKNNKAIIASNIMYVVGQYPRFLRAHWKFLKTVVKKNFEFMHELHPGVRDMACDTFLKISQKCKRKFVVLQEEEKAPFVEELLMEMPKTISDLEPHQVQTYYQAVGHMVAAQNRADVAKQLLMQLMRMPNEEWRNIMAAAQANVNFLHQVQTVRTVSKIMRLNIRVAGAVGPPFKVQLGNIYLDILNVYRVYSEFISNAVKSQGPEATQHPTIRAMRSAKAEILRLITTFVERVKGREGGNTHIALVAQNFIPPLLIPVLADYQQGIPESRDPNVLGLFRVVIETCGERMTSSVPKVLEAVLACTVQMIARNFVDFPEHRINFYELLLIIVKKCFPAIFQIPPPSQKTVIDAIVWGLKHTERNIANLGLELLHTFLEHVNNTPQVAQQYYSSFLLNNLNDVFYVLTDRLHKSQFAGQCKLMRFIFSLIEHGKVTQPLWDAQRHAGMNSNQQFVRVYMAEMLTRAFPNMAQQNIQNCVIGFFNMSLNEEQYRTNVRDFLIQIQEFSGGDDNSQLYAAEKAAQKEQAAKSQHAARAAVPGMLNPHEVEDDDDNL